ncbi:MAG: glycine cleavage system protein R [Planctomycetota bacterium]|nr:glycine cleavage system protein R [Planctomycetota bacterium]
MSHYAVLTAVGEDKPGLVDSISAYILECGCNLEDSRMAILGGEFAMLILVNGEKSAIEKVLQGAAGVGERAGLAVQARATKAPGGGTAIKLGAIPFEIEAYSMDHPGIVHRIAHYLAERKINVRALETRVSLAPTTGMPLFSLHATVDVPTSAKVAEVRKGLEDICASENIDIEMKRAGQ